MSARLDELNARVSFHRRWLRRERRVFLVAGPLLAGVMAACGAWPESAGVGVLAVFGVGVTSAAFYRIESLRWADGVDDMWFTTCRFTPASSPLGQRAIEAMTRSVVRSPVDVLACWWEIPDCDAAGIEAVRDADRAGAGGES